MAIYGVLNSGFLSVCCIKFDLLLPTLELFMIISNFMVKYKGLSFSSVL